MQDDADKPTSSKGTKATRKAEAGAARYPNCNETKRVFVSDGSHIRHRY